MSIVVVALNPSIDVEWKVDAVQWEEKNVIQNERRWPGGKGVNVARWLKFFKADSRLIIPVGGLPGDELRLGLVREGICSKPVQIKQGTRANVIVTTLKGRQLRFNPRGPKLHSSELSEIFAEIDRSISKTSTMVLSGSLPRDLNAGTYAQILKRNHSIRAIVDCDGDAFHKSVAAKPFLVKPNEFELSQWAGRPLKTEKLIIDAARRLSAATGSWVFVSRGGDGALLINSMLRRLWLASSPTVAVRNTVGAGDALLAAVTHQVDRGEYPEQWIRWGVATGCAAVTCEAGILPRITVLKGLVSSIRVTEKGF